MRARISWAIISWATLAALLLAAISVAVTFSLIDYPLGVAWDELVKLRGVRTGRYAYYHPLFMIDLAQAAALVLQPPDLPSLAHLVRVLGALAGGVMVFATFSLARLVLPNLPALAAAAASGDTALRGACPPLQGGYFLRGFARAGACCADRLLQEPAPHRAILLGVLAGLAAGSKYIGALILPFAVVAILLVPTPGPERLVEGLNRHRHLDRRLSPHHAAGDQAYRALAAGREFRARAFGARSCRAVPLRLTWRVFHLRESLWPGLGTPLLALGLIGLAAPFVAARERRMPLALIASFTLLWYAVHEATPLKPFPDFSRYMLPLVPLLVILGASFIYELLSRFDRRGAIAAIAVLLAAVPALSMSLRINSPDVDPRTIVPPIVAASGARAIPTTS